MEHLSKERNKTQQEAQSSGSYPLTLSLVQYYLEEVLSHYSSLNYKISTIPTQ